MNQTEPKTRTVTPQPYEPGSYEMPGIKFENYVFVADGIWWRASGEVGVNLKDAHFLWYNKPCFDDLEIEIKAELSGSKRKDPWLKVDIWDEDTDNKLTEIVEETLFEHLLNETPAGWLEEQKEAWEKDK